MAINFAFVVPKEEVEKYGADFGHHPVGTGAFKFGEWELGQKLVLERNKDYHRPGVPYLDQITFEFGQEPTVALLRLKKGEVDILGDGIPPAQFLQVTSDPANKDLYVRGEQMHTGYVTLNVKVKPFDDLKVRQAVNMAINKKRIVQIINGRAEVANQVLPPSLPGYDKDFQGYPYDPAKAKALLAEAGHPDGFSTELYATDTDPQPRIAQAIQQDLAAIGIKADIKSLSGPAVIEAGGTEGGAPMVWSGGLAWIADFPDPSDFYTVILGCAGAVKGGWNWSWYCNPEIDKRAAAADAMVERVDAGPARRGLEGRLRRCDEGCALGPDHERGALHHAFGPAGRRSHPLHRADPHPGELRIHLRQGRPVAAASNGLGRGRIERPRPFRRNLKQRRRTMAEHCNHTIHKHHLGWNNANEPVLSIASGETIEFRTVDSSGRQITPKSTVADIPKLDFAKVNPVSGPIYIDGRRAGRCGQGDPARFHAQRLGLDREYPGLRPARRPVQGAGAAYLDL